MVTRMFTGLFDFLADLARLLYNIFQRQDKPSIL